MTHSPNSNFSTSDESSRLRILDASGNRAAEGLRVVEDYLRFALDDRHLTYVAKRLRHDLAAALEKIPRLARHLARDTPADVGTTISTPAETRRTNLQQVVAASLKRTEQALRSLEEYSKVGDAALAAEFEQLRYRLYTLERAADITQANLERLATAQLYVLVDGGPSPEAFVALVEELVAAGVHVLQLRDKQLTDAELLARARLLRAATRDRATLFIMNDRPDLALLSQADGVHVGQDELSIKDARTIVGPDRLVGVSTHSLDQARRAVLDGADYLGVGPTFPSSTKSFDAFPGLEFVAAVAQEIRLPAFAIGGIYTQNAAAVCAAGITRVAVGAAITAAAQPKAAVQEMLRALQPAE